MSDSSIFVEWLSEGSGKGSLKKLFYGMNAINILNDGMDDQTYRTAQYQMVRDLSDASVLDFVENGYWVVQRTRIAIIRQAAGEVRAVVCGARDSRVNLALEALPSTSRTERLGQFGLQVSGPTEALRAWADQFGLPLELHWVGLQVKTAVDQLGSTSARHASEPVGEVPVLSVVTGPIEVRRLENGFRRETTSSLPRCEPGVVLEVAEQYTARRRRFVGTDQGWLRAPYVWAPWICAASVGKRLTEIRPGCSMSVPLWARLPEGLSRAVTLASGLSWTVADGKLVSGLVPAALAYNLKRLLSQG